MPFGKLPHASKIVMTQAAVAPFLGVQQEIIKVSHHPSSMYFSAGSPETVEAVRTHLKSLRDWNFDCLLVCTFIVAAGLLMELPEIVQDMCEIHGRRSRELKYWLTPSIDRREYPKHDWVKKWAALGWVLIVLGVTGEGVFEAYVSKYDSALSNITDTVVAEAQKESANAEATAKGFDARIAESDAKAKSAEATAKQFEAQIAGAQPDAAESKKEAESERLERVKLQKQLEPRRLTGEQKEKLRSLLSDVPQQIMFGWCMTGSDDCQDFVNDIGDAFNKAGWKTWFAASTEYKRGIRVGFMKGSDDKLVAHWVPKIRNALAEVGVSSEQTSFDPNDRTLVGGFQKNVLYLIVGQKPAIKAATANDSNQ